MSDERRSEGDRLLDYHLGESTEEERAEMEAALDERPELRRRLDAERVLDAALRRRLARTPAPPGLETRVRAALADEARDGRSTGWWRRPWVAAVAGIALIVAFVWVSRDTWNREAAGPAVVRAVLQRTVLVVDHHCDRMGLPLAFQRRCTDRDHLNALKLDDGSYWQIALADERSRRLVVDPEMRGHRLIVGGELYGDIRTLQIEELTDLGLEMQTTDASIAGRHARVGGPREISRGIPRGNPGGAGNPAPNEP